MGILGFCCTLRIFLPVEQGISLQEASYVVCVLSGILNVVDLYTDRDRQFQHLGLQERMVCLPLGSYLLCMVCGYHSRALADRQKLKCSIISQNMTLVSLKCNQYKQCQKCQH